MCTAAQSARMVPCYVSPLFVTLLADLMSLILCENDIHPTHHCWLALGA